MIKLCEMIEDKVRRKIIKSLADQHAILNSEEIDSLVEHELAEIAKKIVGRFESDHCKED